MSEVLKVIKERYSCRSYNGESLAKEQVEALALAAVSAPSAMNKQPWQIIVLTNKGIIDEMNDTVMDYLSKQEDKTIYDSNSYLKSINLQEDNDRSVEILKYDKQNNKLF